MNVLSLFDGMSCGQIALNNLRVDVDNYFASEIKTYAIEHVKKRFPKTIQIGDVRNVNVEDLPNIDLLIGGSPCKGISRLNQKQEGLEHKESVLFWEYYRIYKKLLEKNPNLIFLLENTHGNKEATNIITNSMGVSPISINSKYFSAQNRPRYYWTNVKCIDTIVDKNITTNDVFEYNGKIINDNRERWLNSKSGKKSIAKGYTKINPYPKAGCITANGHKKWNENYVLKDGVFRHLSIRELEKLQTLPIGYCDGLSYEEAYDLIGDGWTIDVIAHILKNAI